MGKKHRQLRYALIAVILVLGAVTNQDPAQADLSSWFQGLTDNSPRHAHGTNSSPSKCSQLANGQEVIIKDEGGGTQIPRHYALSRTDTSNGGENYEATLNLDFRTSDPLVKPEDLERLRTKASQCMAMYSPYLLDDSVSPNRKLTLKLAEKGQAKYQTILTPIEVVTHETRDDYQHFSVKIDCPTMIHEFLHHLGLVDLYPERNIEAQWDSQWSRWVFDPGFHTSTGAAQHPVYNCRLDSRSHSIMNKVYDAAVGVGAACQRVRCWYEEPSVGSNHELAVAAMQQAFTADPFLGCPGNVGNYLFNVDDYGKEAFREPGKTCAGRKLLDANSGEFEIELPVPAEQTSLITPGEFRKIVEPGCPSTQLYDRCSRFAYMTSYTRDLSLPTCPEPPAECRDSDQWLR
jgi:hypothetical protein